jgi:hypothetical protein
MNLVDSCGWLEYFADGPNAEFYDAALEDPGSLLVPNSASWKYSNGSFIKGEKMPPSRLPPPCARAWWCP